MNRKAAIISIRGSKLTASEISLLKKERPWGIILFKRNIISFKQTKNLTQKIRSCMKDPFYPILIDEEGGKVSRLSGLFSTKQFSQYFFGHLYEKNNKNGKLIYKYYLETICNILNEKLPLENFSYNELINFVKDRPGHDFRYSLDNNKIKELGWKPKFSWEKGIEDTVKWYLDNKNYLN